MVRYVPRHEETRDTRRSVLRNTTGARSALHNTTGAHFALRDTTGAYSVLRNTTGAYSALRNTTGAALRTAKQGAGTCVPHRAPLSSDYAMPCLGWNWLPRQFFRSDQQIAALRTTKWTRYPCGGGLIVFRAAIFLISRPFSLVTVFNCRNCNYKPLLAFLAGNSCTKYSYRSGIEILYSTIPQFHNSAIPQSICLRQTSIYCTW